MSARTGPARATFTVCLMEGCWAVEHEGQIVDRCSSKEEAKAAANKRARAAQDAGQACQVRVTGEAGFFAAA